MNLYIKQALNNLNRANYAGYFEEISKVVPDEERGIFNNLRSQFISGRYDFSFENRLMAFAKQIDDVLPNSDITSATISKTEDITTLKKQLMRGDVDGSIEKLNEVLEARGDNFFINRMILISSQYNSIGTLAMKHEQVSRERAKIIRELLNLMDDLR